MPYNLLGDDDPLGGAWHSFGCGGVLVDDDSFDDDIPFHNCDLLGDNNDQ